MKSLVQVRLAGNRLSAGIFNTPFTKTSRINHETVSQNRRFSASTRRQISTTRPLSTMASTSKLIELAATITRETEKLDKYMKEKGLPAPSFEPDALLNFPRLDGEAKRAREEVVRATKELGDLVTGPTESVRWMAWDVSFPFRCDTRKLMNQSTTILFRYMLSTITRSVRQFRFSYTHGSANSQDSTVISHQ